jgi:uncharacterized protein (DUF2147 family)
LAVYKNAKRGWKLMAKETNVVRIAAFLGLTLIGCASALASEPTGTWMPSSADGKIRIDSCGGSFCGTVVWEKSPHKDLYNPDESKHDNPVVGTRILSGFKPTGKANEWRGRVYNTQDGKTYDAYITMTSESTLDLKGCVLGGWICKTDQWTRTH